MFAKLTRVLLGQGSPLLKRAYRSCVKPGSVRNADRKCKAKTNLVSACGKPNLGAYTAKPNLPGPGGSLN